MNFPTPMQFRISDTFTDSLARLTGDEQKALKTVAFDLQFVLSPTIISKQKRPSDTSVRDN